jgi:germination protein M
MTDEQRPLPPGDAATRRDSRNLRAIIIAAVVLLAGGLWLVTLVPGWLSRRPATEAPAGEAPAEEAATARRIQVTLFYVADDGTELVGVSREVPYGTTTAEQARHILAAQVRRPPAGFVSAIPTGTTVRTVFIGARGEAYVDLSPEASLSHTGGSLDEALAVFAIVNALTVNLPDVGAVQILVDGKEVDTLAGHIDLREPLARSDDWIRKGQ